MIALYLTCALAACCVALYAWLRRCLTYWQRRGVPFAKPSVPFGNYTDSVLGRRRLADVMHDIYVEHRGERYVGTYFFNTPVLQIHDPAIIQQVFIKEFQDFFGRGMYSDPVNDPLSGHLFSLSGPKWRTLRVKMSPAFTTGKIKYMFSTIIQCADHLRNQIDDSMAAGGGCYEDDVRELLARFSTDIISSVAFGIESNSMKNPESEFRRMGQRALEPTFDVGLRSFLSFFQPDVMKALRIRSVPAEVHNFFTRIVTEMVDHRESSGVERADMLNMLIKLKNEGFIPPDAVGEDKKSSGLRDQDTSSDDIRQKISIKELTAQVFVFFLAGFETTSSTASYTLFELAKHPDIQDKVYAELDAVLREHDGKLTYEAIMDLKYMDMVIHEAMRHYPAVPFLTREAMVRRQLPLTDLMLDKGMRLMVPVASLHKDPEYWPDPERFDPTRFTEEGKRGRPAMAYLPFGDGPRICIGMRLGMVQVKISLATILSKAKVSLVPGAPRKLEVSPLSIVPSPINGCRVLLTAR